MLQKITEWLGLIALKRLSAIEPIDGGDVTDFDQKKDNIEEKFIDAYYRRTKQYLAVALIIVIVYGYDSTIGGANLQAYGLAIDGMGALILVRSVIRGKAGIARDTPEQIGRLAGSEMDLLNQNALSAVAENTIDGLYGGILLFFGFVIQEVAILNIL